MKLGPTAFALVAGTTLLPGASVSDRLDLLEEKVSGMEELLRTLRNTPHVQPSRPSSPAHSSRLYQIRKGDSYWSIARRHSVPVSALERANPGVNPLTLSIGRNITIPDGSRSSTPLTPPGPGTYRVKRGDILGRISEAHGIRLYQLLDANPGLNPRRLKIGTILSIPGQSSQAEIPMERPSPVKPPAEAPPPGDQSTGAPPNEFRPNPYLTEFEEPSPETKKLARELPPMPLVEPRLITVKEDRRLSEIAEQHKTTVARINQLNKRNLSPKQMIKEGSQLYIPTH